MLTVLVAVGAASCARSVPATVTVDPQVRHQTIIGWEATVDLGDADIPQDSIALYRRPLIDFLIDSVGITALRLEVRSGDENPNDRTPAMLADIGEMSYFKRGRYIAVNDNDDPFVVDPNGFRWTWMDHLVRTTVLPFREAMDARGESFYLTLTFVDFELAEFEQLADPEEYAEFIAVAFTQLRDSLGIVPDALEVLLEPDVGQIWDPHTLRHAIPAAGNRLRLHGFEPAFVVGSTSSMWQSFKYFDWIVADSAARGYVTDLAYHRYQDLNDAWLVAIGERTRSHGIRTGMLEKIDADYHALHDDLGIANVSRWQQYAMGWPLPLDDDGSIYALVSRATPDDVEIIYGRRTAMLSRYFQAIRPGAVRIDATSDHERVEPLAFDNPDGSVTAVLKTSGPAEISLRGLPPGPVAAQYMTEDDLVSVALEGVEADAAGVAVVAIPGAGVVTLRSTSP